MLVTLQGETYLMRGVGGPGDSWKLQAERWVPASASPPVNMQAVEHEAEGAVYGVDGVSALWRWDGQTWERVLNDGPSGMRIVYDSARQRIVGVSFWDYGTYALQDGQWVEIGGVPSSVGGASIAYDRARDTIVMFGGWDIDEYYTWGERWLFEFDFDRAQWTSVPVSGPWPPGRSGHAMFYDHANEEVVVVGGEAGEDRVHACIVDYYPRPDSWAWNGAGWRRLGDAPGHTGISALYDPTTGLSVLAGGYRHRVYSPDCEEQSWYYDNLMVRTDGAWSDMPGKIAPKRFDQFRVAYHPDRGLLAHGGQSVDPLWGDIYTYEESSVYLGMGRFGSGARGYEASAGDLAYDPVRGELVGFGGNLWGYRQDATATLGPTGEWTVRSPAATPPERALHAMGWDPGLERVLMYGGNVDDRRLWIWDGANWEAHVAEGPDLGQNAAMVYDAGADAMLLVGSSGQSWYFEARAAETWRPTGAPNLGMTNVRLISIPGYGIIAGGKDGLATPLYRWTGGDWQLVTNRPAGRVEDFGYDPALNAVVFSSSDAWKVWHWTPPCRVDLDCDGQLTIFDFLEFANAFDAGDARADFDGDGAFTVFDFLAFQNAFDDGCP
jgi:hypothetical protein